MAGIPFAKGAEHLRSGGQQAAAQEHLRSAAGSLIDKDIGTFIDDPDILSHLEILKDELNGDGALSIEMYDYIAKALVPTGQVSTRRECACDK